MKIRKTIILSTIAIATTAFIFTSCGSDATKAEDAKDVATDSEVNYTVDATTSIINWRGTKVVGMGEHKGTLAIREGSVGVKENALASGNFTIDMKSIFVADTASWFTDDKRGQLTGHLQSDDFFNVATYPTAKFEITSVEGNNISGNLTLRDVTKNITFPAEISISENEVTANGTVVINRLDWNINYDKEKMSLSESAQASAKNGIVGKDIEIAIALKATK